MDGSSPAETVTVSSSSHCPLTVCLYGDQDFVTDPVKIMEVKLTKISAAMHYVWGWGGEAGCSASLHLLQDKLYSVSGKLHPGGVFPPPLQ
ncbi:hypothetical protein INR49_000922, partial [Caranx melampygus]